MSRSHDAKRKAARRMAKAEAEASASGGTRRHRLWIAIPLVLIVAVPAAVALIGPAGTAVGMSDAQAQRKVAAVLTGMPQQGTALGSPKAPLTLEMFADLECPTVKKFAETYLPHLLDAWVRTGTLRIEYRPLQTDTTDEHTFFQQEIATLAAGRQGRLWNYALTFLYEQKPHHTDYADEGFFDGIAEQVPRLNLTQWRRARPDPRLTGEVIDSVYLAHSHSTIFTPSFFIGPTPGASSGRTSLVDLGAERQQIESELQRVVATLEEEVGQDRPTVRGFESLGLNR